MLLMARRFGDFRLRSLSLTSISTRRSAATARVGVGQRRPEGELRRARAIRWLGVPVEESLWSATVPHGIGCHRGIVLKSKLPDFLVLRLTYP
jgi:hypothetical protein